MSSRLRTMLVMAAALGAVGWTLGAQGQTEGPSAGPPAARERRPVTVERSSQAEQVEVAVFHAVTRAVDRTVVAFTLPGRVHARPVEVGTTVARGQVLARLDAKPLRNAASAARARLAEVDAQKHQLERDQLRQQSLFEAGATSTQQLEQATSGTDAIAAARDAAEANLAETQRQLAETTLRAPFDGEVSAVFIEPGQVVDGGTPVVELRGSQRQEVELSVPARVAAGLEVGTAVTVSDPAGRQAPTTGVIRRVASVSGGAGRLHSVLVELAERDAPQGVPVRVELPVTTHRRVSIPLPALLDPSGTRPHVFVHEDGRVVRRPVEVAALVGDRVLLAAGLEDGEEVVVRGLPHLLDGDAVEAVR